MKIQKTLTLVFAVIALTLTLAEAQTKSTPLNQNQAQKAKNLVKEPKDWIGAKILFLPFPLKAQNFGYFWWGYTKKISSIPKTFGIKYKDLVGKTAEIVNVQKDRRSYLYTTVKIKGKKKFVVNKSLERLGKRTLHNIAFISEFNLAKEMVGMKIWSNRVINISTTSIPPTTRNDYFGKLSISNLQQCKVLGIDWGYTALAPIRFNLDCGGGKLGFWDGSIYTDNAKGVFRPFPIAWHNKNPKLLYPKWSSAIWKTIKASEITIGMTPKMVEMSWGKPKDINRTVGKWGVHEQWVYGSIYIYFEDGKMTSWQD